MSPPIATSDFHDKLLAGLQLHPIPLAPNYTPPSTKTKLHENNHQPLASESLCESGSEISRTPTATTATSTPTGTSTPTATSCTPSSPDSTPPIIEEHASHSHEKPASTTARISKTELLMLRMMLCQPILESLAMQSHQSDMLNLMLTNDRIAGAIEGTSGPRPTMQKLREWTCRSTSSDDLASSHKQFACWGCGGRICTDCCYTKVVGAPPRAHQCKIRCDTCYTKQSFNMKFFTSPATARTCMCHNTQIMRFYRFQNQLKRKVCSTCMITPPQDLTRAWWKENSAKSPNPAQSCTWPGLPKCGLCGVEAGAPRQVDNHNNSSVRASEGCKSDGNQAPETRLRFICLGCGGLCRERVHWNQPEPKHLWYPIRYR